MSWVLARSRAAGDVTLHDAGVDLDRERGRAVTDSFPCRAPAAVLKVLEALGHGGSEQLHVVGDALQRHAGGDEVPFPSPFRDHAQGPRLLCRFVGGVEPCVSKPPILTTLTDDSIAQGGGRGIVVLALPG